MDNITHKVTGDSLTADEFNQGTEEIENAIISSGQGLGPALNMLGQTIATYSSGGDFYTDSGTANAHVLSPVGIKETPHQYFDGMRVRYRVNVTNTSSVVNVNVNSLGSRPITGAAIGTLAAGELLELTYSQSNSSFQIISAKSNIYLTLADAVSDPGLGVGINIETLGYYTAGDGGSNHYQTVSPGTGIDDGGSIINSANSQLKGLFLNGVNSRQFGMQPSQGSSVNGNALLNAFRFTNVLKIPAGEYSSSVAISKSLALSEDMVVLGDGPGVSIIVFQGIGSAGFTLTQATGGGQQLDTDQLSIVFLGLSVKTTAINAGIGILIQNTIGQGDTVRPILIKDVTISGHSSVSNSTFNAGVHINAPTFSNVINYVFKGANFLGGGIRFQSSQPAVDNNIINYRQLNGSYMIKIDGFYEGFNISQITGVGCDRGIEWDAALGTGQTAKPVLCISGGHINVNKAAIKTENIVQVTINGVSFYSLVPGGVSVEMSHPANSSYVQKSQMSFVNNVFHGTLSGAGTDAFILSNFTDGVVIEGNTFTLFPRVLTYDSTVRNVKMGSSNDTDTSVIILNGPANPEIYYDQSFHPAGTRIGHTSGGVVNYQARHVFTTSGSPSIHTFPIPTNNGIRIFTTEIKSVVVSFSGLANIDASTYVIWDALANAADLDNIHIKVFNAVADSDGDICFTAIGI